MEAGLQAAAAGEVPVGAVLVAGGQIISRAHNETSTTGSPIAHAEILCIQYAAAALKSWCADATDQTPRTNTASPTQYMQALLRSVWCQFHMYLQSIKVLLVILRMLHVGYCLEVLKLYVVQIICPINRRGIAINWLPKHYRHAN